MAGDQFTELLEGTGIRHLPNDVSDWYEGAKDELIAAGICRAEWFPDAPQRYGKGWRLWRGERRKRVKRSFDLTDGDRGIWLHDVGYRGVWRVTIGCSTDERLKRQAKRRELMADEAAIREARAASVFEADRESLELLTAFRFITDPRNREAVLDLARYYAEDATPAPRPGLRLVVDNDPLRP